MKKKLLEKLLLENKGQILRLNEYIGKLRETISGNTREILELKEAVGTISEEERDQLSVSRKFDKGGEFDQGIDAANLRAKGIAQSPKDEPFRLYVYKEGASFFIKDFDGPSSIYAVNAKNTTKTKAHKHNEESHSNGDICMARTVNGDKWVEIIGIVPNPKPKPNADEITTEGLEALGFDKPNKACASYVIPFSFFRVWVNLSSSKFGFLTGNTSVEIGRATMSQVTTLVTLLKEVNHE